MNNDLVLKALQRARDQAVENDCQVLYSSQLTRSDRELLQRTGWLEELIRGWYLLVRPDVQAGDTTPWYANFWDFLRLYLSRRYGDDYVLSAESSLLLHTGSTVIPQQVIVIIPKGGAGLVELPYRTSVYSYVDRAYLPGEVDVKLGLRLMNLPSALARTSPVFFRESSEEARIALCVIPSPEALAVPLITNGLHASAGRLVGGLEAIGRREDSVALYDILTKGGLRVTSVDPLSD